MTDKRRNAIMWIARLIPLVCMSAALGWMLLSGRSVTAEDILHYTPAQPVRAALFLWLAFALKSLSMVFPIMVLFAVGGQLFPLPVALAVNTVGVAIALTLPYLLGRASELSFSDTLTARYPKLYELRRMREDNAFILSLLSRAIGILPCDVVSLYFGSVRMPYPPYIAGAVLGFMPDLICATLLGRQIEAVGSPGFWITVAINLLACLVSMLLYRVYRRRYGQP